MATLMSKASLTVEAVKGWTQQQRWILPAVAATRPFLSGTENDREQGTEPIPVTTPAKILQYLCTSQEQAPQLGG